MTSLWFSKKTIVPDHGVNLEDNNVDNDFCSYVNECNKLIIHDTKET